LYLPVIGYLDRSVFSDESKVEIGANKRVYVWRKAGEEWKLECTNFYRKKFGVMVWGCISYNGTPLRYDTIRDAILTYARKPTYVGLIYRTETTTKNCKTEKLKSTKTAYARGNRLRNYVVSAEEEKERLQ